jgi:hypothetical protein
MPKKMFASFRWLPVKWVVVHLSPLLIRSLDAKKKLTFAPDFGTPIHRPAVKQPVVVDDDVAVVAVVTSVLLLLLLLLLTLLGRYCYLCVY